MNSNRQWEVESKLLYSLIVAGKNAKFADAKTLAFMGYRNDGEMPFDLVRRLFEMGELGSVLRVVGTGNYRKLEKAFSAIAKAEIDLENCTPADLEAIHGIGPKTSRFFIMWIRPKEEYAALDVHVLRWMRGLGYAAPKSTPSGKKYAELEKAFLAEAKKRGMTPRELDSEIWEAGARSNNIPEAR